MLPGRIGATAAPIIVAAAITSAIGYGITVAAICYGFGAIPDWRMVGAGAVAQLVATALVYVVAVKARR